MRMNHPNVLSIEGVAPELFEFCMVSRWMENGTISEYVKQYVGVNRLELVGLRGDSTIRIRTHGVTVNRCHLRSQLFARERRRPRGLKKCNCPLPMFSLRLFMADISSPSA